MIRGNLGAPRKLLEPAVRHRLALAIVFVVYAGPGAALHLQPEYEVPARRRGGGGWLSETGPDGVDHRPPAVFIGIGEIFYRLQAIELSYVAFALLAATYAYALAGCVAAANLYNDRRPPEFLLFAALFLMFHAWRATFSDGLADQFLLGRDFQPCVFGVLLLMSIHQYLVGRVTAALLLCVATATLHPDYLPTCLACGLVFSLFDPQPERRFWARCILAHVSLLVILLAPGVLYLLRFARPTSTAAWQQAMHLLAEVRIPHHASVSTWFGVSAVARLLVMTAGTYYARRRALIIVMDALWSLIGGSIVIAVLFPVPVLEAITPWRASVVLMPLALTVILARIARWTAQQLEGRERLIVNLDLAVMVLAVAAGIIRQIHRLGEYADAASMPSIAVARAGATSGQLYLVPPRRRGDFDRFRLKTGVPILIDWKTHPYKDVELLEWFERYHAAADFYAATDPSSARALLDRIIERYRITHVILPAHAAARDCRALHPLHETRVYEMFAASPRMARAAD
ncbi:MAG TPA: DUF6798 domain-containing protein [Candidatus Methylomirabilis sp.]|nr:DUF6798 domain-containing protein [Candidatus Methylomirabilis sp.]